MSQPKQPKDSQSPIHSNALSAAAPTTPAARRPVRPTAPRTLLVGPAAGKLEEAAQNFSMKHDEASFTVLCRASEPLITDFVLSTGIDENDVEDVFQDTRLVVWQQRDRFSGSYDQFVAFAVTIARNSGNASRRRDGRWHRTAVLATDPDAPCAGTEDCEDGPTPEELVAANELLNLLPTREQQVLRERAGGRTWREIGEALGLTGRRVQQIHAGALKRLGQLR